MPFSSSQWAILLPKNASLFPEITFYFPELPFHFPEVPFCFHKYLFISQKCPNVFHNSPWVLQKCLLFIYWVHLFLSRVSHSGGDMGERPPPSHIFWNPLLIKTDAPHGVSPRLKMKLPNWKTTAPHWKMKFPFRKRFLEKKIQKKSETIINTCVSLIKQHWKKMAAISQKRDLLTWSIQRFIRKVKHFVRKYYITWLITGFIAIDIAPLICSCSLFCNCPLLKVTSFNTLSITCLVRAIFRINHSRDFWKFWNCPRFIWEISKFSKMYSGNFFPNRRSKHVITSTNWLG